jgi:hypothetical protein
MKIDISIGELVDRVTICEIKLERIADPAKKAHEEGVRRPRGT